SWAFMPGVSCLEEGEQVGVDGFGLRRRHAVRKILVGFQRTVSKQLGGERPRGDIGHDLIIPIALTKEEQHLSIPIVCRERPAVAKHDGLSLTPILVENFDAVLGSHYWHSLTLMLTDGKPLYYVSRRKFQRFRRTRMPLFVGVIPPRPNERSVIP